MSMDEYTRLMIARIDRAFDKRWVKVEFAECFLQRCCLCGKVKQCEYRRAAGEYACKECAVVDSI